MSISDRIMLRISRLYDPARDENEDDNQIVSSIGWRNFDARVSGERRDIDLKGSVTWEEAAEIGRIVLSAEEFRPWGIAVVLSNLRDHREFTQKELWEGVLAQDIDCPVELITDKGRVRIAETTLAGIEFVLVEFLEGDLASRKLWMRYDGYDGAAYEPHYDSDGILFNKNPEVEVSDGIDIVGGGEYLPELEDLKIVLLDDPIIEMQRKSRVR